MIWKILILVAFVVLVALYLNERRDRVWWMTYAAKWQKQAEECLDLAKRQFDRGMVKHRATGEILQVYGAIMVSMANLQTFLLVFMGDKWRWLREDEVEPASIPDATEPPTEGPTYVHFDGKPYQTDETITATM